MTRTVQCDFLTSVFIQVKPVLNILELMIKNFWLSWSSCNGICLQDYKKFGIVKFEDEFKILTGGEANFSL